jgi:formate dehydrogenase major subunit
VAGITWERLEREHSVTYPCLKEGDPGDEVIFVDHFPTADGRGKLVAADFTRAAEVPDNDYPMVLITGRLLEHWHTGAMTRRAQVLDAIEPVATVSINPVDMVKLQVEPGDYVTVESRRGKVSALARRDPATPPGAVFMPFAFVEAAANILTNPALDPFGKIPEYKYCAVRVARGDEAREMATYGVAATK